MSKRLFVSIILALLAMLGIGWMARPAYASSLNSGNPSFGAFNTPIDLSAMDYLHEAERSIQQDNLRTQPINSPIKAVSRSSVLLKPQPVRGVALHLVGPEQVDLAKPIVLTGVLRDSLTGAGIANKTITISTGGFYLGQTHTDDTGVFNIKISKVLRAGKYLVTATFKGAHLLAPASDDVWLEILPATIRIQTVPAIPGITFQMDGRKFVSGADGMAKINILQAGQYDLAVLIDQYQNPSQQIEFGRWSEETSQPSRQINVPNDSIIQVGINVFHKVSFKFVDLDGFPVDPARISSISMRSVQGDVFTLKPGDSPWLPTSRTARRAIGLEETELLYSVNSVNIDGSNVVNSAQQRFYARTDDTWTITLLLYSLNITARDGLFASPIGKSVSVTFPDGQTKTYELDQSGSLQIHALARGIYHITLNGVKGLGTTTPVALSRNQVVKMKIVTKLDVAVIGSVGFGFAIGLVLYGRPQLIKNLWRKKRRRTSSLGWTTNHEP